MNEDKSTRGKFILFVSVLIITIFIIAYVMYDFTPDKEEAQAIAIEGVITSINNNLLSVNIGSISPEIKRDIGKALVIIDDSTKIVSSYKRASPASDFLSQSEPLSPLELIDKNNLSIGYKVRILTNADKIIISQSTNVIEARAGSIQLT